MKIIDCFQFFNEFTVLDIRLNTLYDAVDKFVLVEATRSHQNKEKPLYFEENKHRYSKFLDKIVHIVIDEYPEFNYWSYENYQRDYILKSLLKLNLDNSDMVFVSDCDEIWNPKLIELIPSLSPNLVHFWPSYITYHYFNVVADSNIWYQGYFTNYGKLHELCVQDNLTITNISRNIQAGRPDLESIKVFLPDAPMGWHFSYTENIEYKLQNFVHSEYRNMTSDNFFNALVNHNKNPFHTGVNTTLIDKAQCLSTLPEYVKENLDKYWKYLL